MEPTASGLMLSVGERHPWGSSPATGAVLPPSRRAGDPLVVRRPSPPDGWARTGAEPALLDRAGVGCLGGHGAPRACQPCRMPADVGGWLPAPAFAL